VESGPATSPQRVVPEDFAYLGAFRLPEGDANSDWTFSGYGLTFYPGGDPQGPDDGFPGSLFGIGHDHHQLVSEVSIPAPVITRDPGALLRAETLQPFADITGGMFGPDLEIPRADIAYLPQIGDQTGGKLYFTWGQHFQFEHQPSHGWAELDLGSTDPAGPWLVGQLPNYVLNDYLFEIPEAWASMFAPGLRLATGRFRDGVWSGLGPALFAIAPWEEGNPPPPGARLERVATLLLYGENVPGSPEIDVSSGYRMDGYSEPDEWSGAEWLTAGDRSAVAFVGTKALGESWYGFANGVVYPTSGDEDEVYPEVPEWPYDDRGWWSDDIAGQIILFDTAELGLVARGEMEPWEPQPYAMIDITEYLFNPGFDLENGKRHLVGAVAFDRDRGLLYVAERLAVFDGESVVHAFSVG